MVQDGMGGRPDRFLDQSTALAAHHQHRSVPGGLEKGMGDRRIGQEHSFNLHGRRMNAGRFDGGPHDLPGGSRGLRVITETPVPGRDVPYMDYDEARAGCRRHGARIPQRGGRTRFIDRHYHWTVRMKIRTDDGNRAGGGGRQLQADGTDYQAQEPAQPPAPHNKHLLPRGYLDEVLGREPVQQGAFNLQPGC